MGDVPWQTLFAVIAVPPVVWGLRARVRGHKRGSETRPFLCSERTISFHFGTPTPVMVRFLGSVEMSADKVLRKSPRWYGMVMVYGMAGECGERAIGSLE